MPADDRPLITLADLRAPRLDHVEDDGRVRQLVDADQRYLAIVKACVADRDASSLRSLCFGVHAGHAMVEAAAEVYVPISDLGGPPFDPEDSAPVHAARALAGLALELVVPEQEAGTGLDVFRRWIACSGFDVANGPLRNVPAAVAGDVDLLTHVWLTELGGRALSRTAGPRIDVLLDRGGHDGQHAVLSLSTVDGLPAGLVPDPATMTLCSADQDFRSALLAAWHIAGRKTSSAVLWSLADREGPVPHVVQESLSLAFTVLFDELRRRNRRIRGRLSVRGLRSRTAIVGRVDLTDPDAALAVDGYPAKLAVADESLRVVLPRADLAKAVDANTGHGAELVPVDTWRNAVKAARKIEGKRLLTRIIAGLSLLALLASALWWASESQRDAEHRRAVAADLAAQAVSLRDTDPALAARLGLAAHRIDPDNRRAVEALRDVVDDNRNIQRTWQVDPSRVDALAISESQEVILTSGTGEVTKAWSLSSGALEGELPRDSYRLATAAEEAIAAAGTDDGVVLADVGGEQLSELGILPDSTCTDEQEAVAFQFTHSDTTLVVVWIDGAVSRYDVVTRDELSCQTWQSALAPLEFEERLPSNKVIAADVVSQSDVEESGDEVVMVLTNNTVVSTGTDDRPARIEVRPDELAGDASRVAASPMTLSVATPLGVAVWRRDDHRLLANPAGGIESEPRVLLESNGHLVISGRTGTALVPLPVDGWVMADSLAAQNGGAATVAAVSGRALVSGGPAGRISVLGDLSGTISTSQNVKSTAVAFRPDGRLLAAEVGVNVSGHPTGTNSWGLTVLDPASPPTTPDGAVDHNRIRWTNGQEPTLFYANDVAAAPGLLAAAGQVNGRGAVLVWNEDDRTDPRQLLLSPPGEESREPQERIIAAVEFTSDAAFLVARHVSGQIGIWSTHDWESAAVLNFRPGNTRMAVITDRAIVVEGSGPETELVEIDVATRDVRRRVAAPNTLQLAVSGDGTRLITLTEDGTVQVRDEELDPVGGTWRLPSTGEPFQEIALDHSGRRLAVPHGDRVSVYDVERRTLAMATLHADGQSVIEVSWSPDDTYLVGTPMPPVRGLKQVGLLRVWRIDGVDWTSQVCGWTGAGLSKDEWSRFVGDTVPYIELCPEGTP